MAEVNETRNNQVCEAAVYDATQAVADADAGAADAIGAATVMDAIDARGAEAQKAMRSCFPT